MGNGRKGGRGEREVKGKKKGGECETGGKGEGKVGGVGRGKERN
jgi:hypothetical protein